MNFADSFRAARWIRFINLILQAILFLTLFAGLNYLALQHAWRFDLTQGRQHSLSAESKSYLEGLEHNVTITVTLTNDSDNPDLASAYRDISGLLREYAYQSRNAPNGKITVRYLDVYQSRREAEALRIDQPNVVVLESEGHRRIMPLSEFYRVNLKEKRKESFLGEAALTAAILDVSAPNKKKIYFLAGHGEMRPDEVDGAHGLSQLRDELRQRNYELAGLDLSLTHKIPDDTALILIPGQQGRVQPFEQELLRNYLQTRAGRILLLLDPTRVHGLDDLLFDWGIIAYDNIIHDTSSAYLSDTGELMLRHFKKDHYITRNLVSSDLPVLVGPARVVTEDKGRSPDDGLNVNVLMATNDTAWGETSYRLRLPAAYTPGQDLTGQLGVMVVSERLKPANNLPLSVRGGRLAVVGTADLVTNNRISYGGNLNLFLATVSWTVDRDTQLNIPPRPIQRFQLALSRDELMRLRLGLYLVVPGIVALLGLVVFLDPPKLTAARNSTAHVFPAMRSKVTVALLFLNVVLFFYIFQYEKVKLPDANGKRVLGAEVATIAAITRTSRSAAPLKLERRGDAWWLQEPYEWLANPNAVTRLINELQFLEHETSFAVADLTRSGQTLADYGLDQPAFVLTFTSAKKDYVLKIGDDTKIGNRLYVLSPDGQRIHVVGRSLAESVGLPLEDLRADSIFTVPMFEVRSLNIQTAAPNLKVRLRRDAASRWGFETPISARASKPAVVVTINALNALNANKFLDPRDSDLDRAGLTTAALRVTLEGNARRETLLLGQVDSAGDYFAKIEDKAVIFTVTLPPALLATLRTAQEELRETRVLEFEPTTVNALTLSTPGQPELSLQRDAGSTGAFAWQVVTRVPGQAPLPASADTALVEELLQKIHLLAAKKFLSDAPAAADLELYGFNRPEREITLSLSTGGGPQGNEASTLTLQIGVSPNQPKVAFARVKNTPFLYQILPDILTATPSRVRHYRQRLLRELPESARLTDLTLTDLSTNTAVHSYQLPSADKNWDTVLATLPAHQRPPLAALLTELRTLRAKNFTADGFRPEQANTPEGERPWKYRLDVGLALVSGTGATQKSTSTLFLTERLGGTTLLAGSAEFYNGIQFEVTQPMLDALFALTYAEKHDPGPLVPTPTPAPALKPAPPVPPAAASQP